MKPQIFLFLSLFLMALLPSKAQVINGQGKTSAYVLVWADEFDLTGLPDPDKWDYEIGFIRNREPQWYQKQNAYCADGNLIIEAKKERKANPDYEPSSDDWRLNREFANYTSACLISKGKFDFTYGKVKMRAKIDVGKGMWPAFWMLGSNRGQFGWPICGEVDIMEFYRGTLLANAAWQGKNGTAWDDSKLPIAKLGANWAYDFHEWQMIWDEDKIVLSVDGRMLNTIELSKTTNAIKGNNPFHEPFYLLLNFALGQAGEEIPDENLPAKFIVDYVRVYQAKVE